MKAWGTLVAAVLLVGCARFPDTGVSGTTRLTFTLQTVDPIRTGTEPGRPGAYVYIVALRFSNQDVPTDGGPIPVVAPPWGNGFVAGRATHFMLWDPAAGSAYTLYRFVNPVTLTDWFAVGVPIVSEPVVVGSRRIRFEIELGQLFPVQADRDALRTMQVNFLTMDRVPSSGSSKLWDALGDSRVPTSVNDFVSIPLRINGTYDNARSGLIEPSGDVSDPSLDLNNWAVDVRLQ